MSWLKQRDSNSYTIGFMVVLSFFCALILSVLASALAEPKEKAKGLDRSKQMMIAAQIYNSDGYFQLSDGHGGYLPAEAESDGTLVPAAKKVAPSQRQLLEVYQARFKPYLVDDKGALHTFEELNINQEDYIAQYKKVGYYTQPDKLIYAILPNSPKDREKVEGYVIPVNGFGLWDAIYGFLAVKPDGNSVIGISWYDQKETPGLGANIAEASWQSQFPGKKLFQPSVSGTINFKTAPLGLTVVRGKVSEVLGTSPKAASAVDGMAGATLTGNGVTKAYKDVLESYRPFLTKQALQHKE
jgi:Na+-transporting NADH:ubiquinone oxidoreductase subunit C